MDYKDVYITVFDNGISPRTACEILDLVLKRMEGRNQSRTYFELKKYFESVLGMDIKRHYEEHYV